MNTKQISQEINEQSERVRRIALAYQANRTLDALRQIRDECPHSWDMIVKTNAGRNLVALWDQLRQEENTLGLDPPERNDPE